jgi:hypothetical protein
LILFYSMLFCFPECGLDFQLFWLHNASPGSSDLRNQDVVVRIWLSIIRSILNSRSTQKLTSLILSPFFRILDDTIPLLLICCGFNAFYFHFLVAVIELPGIQIP